jgi:hypothetical protein
VKPIPSGPYLKGVQAASSILAQPKGSVARASNLIYRQRGAMNTVDGSQIINWYAGALQSSRGKFLTANLFQPINIARYFMTINDSPDIGILSPRNVVAALASGGSLTSGQPYYYEVTALDGAGGETTASLEVTATPSSGNLSIALTWDTVASAVAYNVYRGTSSGMEGLLIGAGLPVTSNSFVDNGTAAQSGSTSYVILASPVGAVVTVVRNPPFAAKANWAYTTQLPNSIQVGQSFTVIGCSPSLFNQTLICISKSGNTLYAQTFAGFGISNQVGGGGTISGPTAPPGTNTTRQSALFKMPNAGNYPISYSDANIVAKFPPAPIPIQGGEPAGTGGAGGTTGGGVVGGSAPTPLGGQPGSTCPIPQTAQFNNQLMLALGNGYPLQIYTDTGSVPANSLIAVVPIVSIVEESSSGAGGQATVNTTVVHNLPSGAQALIAGNSQPSFNGSFFILSVPTPTSLVIAVAAVSGLTGTGGTLSPTTVPVQNTFVPAFDAWLQETPYAQNSLIVPANVQWAPEVAYAAQQAIVPDAPNGFYYVATKGGTSGATQPSFPVTIGATVTDSGVTWTCAGSSLYYYIATQGGVSGGSSSTFTVPQFPQTVGGTVADGSVIWKNAGLLTSAAPTPPGAAHVIVYSGSLWVANTWPLDNANGIDGPCAIRMSDTNAPNSWNPINQAFLDKDDGTEIQGLATFTISAQGIPPEGSLVVFKDFSTYQIQGVFGASNFSIQRVVTDMGCTAPRSIQFVPGFGIVRLTHLGIAKFDGVRDEIISEEIRPYLFPSNDISLADITPMDQNYSYGSYGFQTANPPMYCVAIPIGSSGGTLTRILCYDLVTKEWGVIDLPFSLGCAVQIRAEGTIPISMLGGFSDGALQRWQAGDIQWYTGAGSPNQSVVNWSFRTQEAASQVADQRLYFRRIAIRGQNTNSTTGIKVVPVVNGIPGTPYTSAPLSSGDFEIFAPILMTGVRVHADISGSGDCQIQGHSFHTVEKPVGAPVVIS